MHLPRRELVSESELDFADIRDPFGKRFWPEFKGRDGCRTPMPWIGEKKNWFSKQTLGCQPILVLEI